MGEGVEAVRLVWVSETLSMLKTVSMGVSTCEPIWPIHETAWSLTAGNGDTGATFEL